MVAFVGAAQPQPQEFLINQFIPWINVIILGSAFVLWFDWLIKSILGLAR
jgi:hypothetical protein